jgi:hypothetical protein
LVTSFISKLATLAVALDEAPVTILPVANVPETFDNLSVDPLAKVTTPVALVFA